MADIDQSTEYRRFAGGIGLRILGVVVSVISTIVTSRGLGVAGRGLLYTCTSASTIAAQLLALGMPSATVLVVAACPSLGREAIRRALAASVGAGSIVLLATGGLSMIGSWIWLSPKVVSLGPILAGLVATQVLLSWCSSLTQALGAVDRIPLIELLYRISTVGWAWTALFPLGLSFEVFLLSLVVVDSIYSFLWLSYLRVIIPASTSSSAWPAEWKGWSVRAYVPLVLDAGMRRVDALLLSSLAGVRQTGLYSIATQVMDVLQIAPTFLGQKAMYAFSAGLSETQAMKWLRRALPLVIIGGMIAASATSGFWVGLLFGEEFTGVGPIILALSVGAAGLAWQTVASKEIAAAGFPLRLSVAWAVSFGALVILMFVLIPRLQAVGAALALSIAYSILAGLIYWVRAQVRKAPYRS